MGESASALPRECDGNDGKTVEWLVDMGAINTMKRAGFDIDRFKVGDMLTIDAAKR